MIVLVHKHRLVLTIKKAIFWYYRSDSTDYTDYGNILWFSYKIYIIKYSNIAYNVL